MSYMFHFPNLKWTRLQAESMNVPQFTATTEGVKEEELMDLQETVSRAKSKYRLEGIYTGALASVYQKTRVEQICRGLGLACISPLWGVDPEAHLRRLDSDGFSVIVVSVSALGLDQSWLGRALDGGSIDQLVALGRKYRFHIGLEGGEGETFVMDAPSFSRRIEIRSSITHWSGDRGYLEITEAALAPKPRQKGLGALSRAPGPRSQPGRS